MKTSGLEVLHVVEACGGGVRRHLKLIIPALMERGVRCGVFAFGTRFENDFADDLAAYREMGVSTWSFLGEGLFLPRLLRSIMPLRSVLRSEQPAIMHLHSSVAGFAGRLAASAWPFTKVVYSPHAFAIHPTMPRGIRLSTHWLESWGAGRTHAYAFVGRSEIQDANILQLPPEKFNLIENGLPQDYRKQLLGREEARRKLGIPGEQLVAVVPCRLSPQKGLPQLLAAIQRCTGLAKGMKVMFCGEGPEEMELKREAEELKISDRVVFTGAIPDLARLLKAFDMAVLPSLYEGLSYVLLECLAAGLPLVVSDILANVPRAELRDCMQTFSVGDIDALADALEQTLAQPEWARERAERGMKFMEHDFMLSTQADKLVALYKRIS